MYEIRGNTIRRIEPGCALWWLIPFLLIGGLCWGALSLNNAINAHQQEDLARQKALYHREVSAVDAKLSGNVRIEDVKNLDGSTSKVAVVHKGGSLEFTIEEPTDGAGFYDLSLDGAYGWSNPPTYVFSISVNGVSSQSEIKVDADAGGPFLNTHYISLKAGVNKITLTSKTPDYCSTNQNCSEFDFNSISVDKLIQ